MIKEFANSLFEALKRLTPKNYVREEDNLNFLKGKIKFSENIRHNCVNQAKFYCEYDEFSENNILNQLFLYIATSLYEVSKNSENKRVLKLIIDYFADIKIIRFDKFKCNKIRLNRNQKLFEKPFVAHAPSVGYIQKYCAGVRENGGQYTHAGVWLVNALFEVLNK